MNEHEDRIEKLSGRLQKSILQFRGKLLGKVPRLERRHLLPLSVLLGMSVAMAASARLRSVLVMKLTMLASTHFLKRDLYRERDEAGTGGE